MTVDWKGMFPALPTQLNEDLSLDLDATNEHLDQMIEAGVHGMVMLGSIGENTGLTAQEKREVLRAAVETAAGRVPILTGVSEYTPDQAIEFAEDSAKLGVDGLMLLPAMVYKADGREAVNHFRTVGEASPLPILCYNNPRYGVDLTPDMFMQLADVESIVAIKEASGDPRRITDLVNGTGDRFILFAGLDDVMLESIMLGCVGTVFGFVCAFPHESMQMWNLAQAGEWEKAREIYRWLMPLLHLDDHPKLAQYTKITCQELGYGNELVRPPRMTLVGEERERVLTLIRDAVANRPDLNSKALQVGG